MRDIFTTEQFRKDLDGLDKPIKERVGKTIRQIKQDPYYPGLQTHPQRTIPHRKIMRSRVNNNFRILWEWLDDGEISLYRVAKHAVIDAIDYLPDADLAGEEAWIRDAETHEAAHVSDWRKDLNQPQPFRHVPLNHLRLFGVPEDKLDEVQNLTDEEEIWELTIPENVKDTLIDILTRGENWTSDSFLDTRQLLYRTTVDQLEGYCEGKIKRLLLNLTDEQMEYVHIKATGPVLIKGVAGSGKTTIGLYRAHYLANLLQGKRAAFGEGASILLITYTKTLATALKQLYIELYDELPYTITISTYASWMLKQINRSGIRLTAAAPQQRRDLIRQAQNQVARKYPQDKVVSRRPPDFLLDELDDVIRARWLTKFDDYQSVNRVGRGIALQARHRALVWEIYGHYQQELDRRNLFDWADLPRLAQKHCHSLPQYDVVIIDEAQDLPPSHLHLAAQLIPDYSESRSLTLLADPAQSIYYRGISWKEAGINIRGGRTRTLAKNFRNTRRILEAARPVLEGCTDLKREDEYIPPTSAHRAGPLPVLFGHSRESEAMQFIVQKIIRLCRDGNYRPSDIAILARQQRSLKNIEKELTKEHIPCAFFRNDFDVFENQVKLITMHSAKGLEFPAVFMIDLDDSIIPRIQAYSETEAEDELQERKLFYVSMTRAAERLYLLYPKHSRCRFLRDLDGSTVNAVADWREEKPLKRKSKSKLEWPFQRKAKNKRKPK